MVIRILPRPRSPFPVDPNDASPVAVFEPGVILDEIIAKRGKFSIDLLDPNFQLPPPFPFDNAQLGNDDLPLVKLDVAYSPWQMSRRTCCPQDKTPLDTPYPPCTKTGLKCRKATKALRSQHESMVEETLQWRASLEQEESHRLWMINEAAEARGEAEREESYRYDLDLEPTVRSPVNKTAEPVFPRDRRDELAGEKPSLVVEDESFPDLADLLARNNSNTAEPDVKGEPSTKPDEEYVRLPTDATPWDLWQGMFITSHVRGLTSCETKIYLICGSHANRKTGLLFITYDTMHEETGVSKGHIDKVLKSLAKRGLMETVRKRLGKVTTRRVVLSSVIVSKDKADKILNREDKILNRKGKTTGHSTNHVHASPPAKEKRALNSEDYEEVVDKLAAKMERAIDVEDCGEHVQEAGDSVGWYDPEENIDCLSKAGLIKRFEMLGIDSAEKFINKRGLDAAKAVIFEVEHKKSADPEKTNMKNLARYLVGIINKGTKIRLHEHNPYAEYMIDKGYGDFSDEE